MKKNEFLLGLISLTVVNSMVMLPAVAEESKSAKQADGKSSQEIKEPTQAELKKSTDRALYIDPISPKTKKKTPAKSTKIKPKSTYKKKVKKAKVRKYKKKSNVAKKKTLYKTIPSNVKSTKKAVNSKSARDLRIKKVSYSSKSNIIAASLNKAGKVAHYKDGEKLKVSVKAYEDCNLMIFNFDGAQLTQIFPNDYQKNPLLKAGDSVVVGGQNSKFEFVASNEGKKPSNEKIFVYAYPVKQDKQPITIAMNRAESSPFRSTQMSLEEYRKLVNSSKTYFERSVKVVAKNKNQLANFNSDAPPNKLELSLVIDNKK